MPRRRKQYRRGKNKRTGRYSFEHRLLAEELLGRPLLSGEVVHHRDGDGTNNDPSNLVVLPSQAHHAHLEAVLRRARSGQNCLFPELVYGLKEEIEMRGTSPPSRVGTTDRDH